MILVDTSVWVDHLRQNNDTLAGFLQDHQVLAHPFVIGELALGNLRSPAAVLDLLQALPQAAAASDAEVLAFIIRHSLSGRGIGYVDAHLLAATLLTSGAMLWTQDRRLQATAEALGVAT